MEYAVYTRFLNHDTGVHHTRSAPVKADIAEDAEQKVVKRLEESGNTVLETRTLRYELVEKYDHKNDPNLYRFEMEWKKENALLDIAEGARCCKWELRKIGERLSNSTWDVSRATMPLLILSMLMQIALMIVLLVGR